MRRDLASGRYVRWTGSFTTHVFHGRYGSWAVQVEIGGRKLSNVAASELKSDGSGIGSVDYLPVSGNLLEVRDQSGHILWSRLSSP